MASCYAGNSSKAGSTQLPARQGSKWPLNTHLLMWPVPASFLPSAPLNHVSWVVPKGHLHSSLVLMVSFCRTQLQVIFVSVLCYNDLRHLLLVWLGTLARWHLKHRSLQLAVGLDGGKATKSWKNIMSWQYTESTQCPGHLAGAAQPTVESWTFPFMAKGLSRSCGLLLLPTITRMHCQWPRKKFKSKLTWKLIKPETL